MITVKTFVFNPFQVNTYLLYDDTKECVIIDAACSNNGEFLLLSKFIEENELKPVKLINTHCHIDHLVGNHFVANKYQIELGIHKAGLPFLPQAQTYAESLGFVLEEVVNPSFFLEDGDVVNFGNVFLKVIYTPGHADGSICLYSENDNFIVVGDVLFYGSIGRTDLPTGNFDVLEESIKTRLFCLPENVVVYTGHGNTTTIGFEKKHNPFLT